MADAREEIMNELSSNKTFLKFKKLSKNAITPTRGSINAAGFELYSADTLEISANSHGIVKTDSSIILPRGTYGRIAPRSGLASKYFLGVGGGVVDCNFRGNVGVILFNHLGKAFKVNKADRIAQLIVEKICTPELVEVEHLEETNRSDRGFGSTGR